jgi:ribosome-binding factor A
VELTVASNRPDRVGEAIRDELSQLLTRAVHDPGVGFITLTRVKVSPDLQVARVYYTSMGDENAQRETAKALKRAAPFLRRQLGQRIRLRRVPEIGFFRDESIAGSDRIEQILQELKAEAASRPSSSAGATATEPRERSGVGVPANERAGGAGPPSPRRGFGEVSPEPDSTIAQAEADGTKPSGLMDDSGSDED